MQHPISLFDPPIKLFNNFADYTPSREALLQRWRWNFAAQYAPKSQLPRELNLEITVSAEQASTGGRIPIDVPIARICSICQGSGAAGFYLCDECEGHGLMWNTARLDVLLAPNTPDNSAIPVSLRHLGVSNLYLNVHVRITTA